jgi:hypothetical protein
MSLEYLNRIDFAQVKSIDSANVKSLGIDSFPTILIFPPGQGDFVKYEGQLKRNDLISFFDKYAPEKSKSSKKSSPPKNTAATQAPVDLNIVEITDQEAFTKECLDKTGICVLSYFVYEPDYQESKTALDDNLSILKELKKKFNSRLVNFAWVNAINKGKKLARDFGISDSYPSMIAIQKEKKNYRLLRTAFDKGSINDFIEGYLSGLGRIPYTFDPVLDIEKHSEL